MTKARIASLIKLSEEKKDLLDSMYGFTKDQANEIAEENMEGLNQILDEKDSLIEKINKIDLEFLQVFSEIKEEEKIEDIGELDIGLYPRLKELKELIKSISSILEGLAQLDEENSKNMKRQMENTKMELKRVKNGHRAYKGYKRPTDGSILIDERK